MRFPNKTAVVTGASRGIGRQIALMLSAGGARTALVARSRDDLEKTKLLMRPMETRAYCTDLEDDLQIERLRDLIHEELGAIDILVNAAGVWHDEHNAFRGPLLQDTPKAQFDTILNVGLRASFNIARMFLPDMIRKGAGKILQISCGFAGPDEARGWLHYYVTNQAIEAFTRGLAAEMREHEIQVNCIAPWFVASEAVLRFFPAESESALAVEDVARLAEFLLSPDADHISGQIIELRSKRDK